jgi:uncharacterized protein (TIGR02246 family)
MTTELPQPIRAFYAAQESNDFEGLARQFAPDGVVRDEGAAREGRAAIAAWMREAKAKYHHRTEVMAVREEKGAYAVSVRVSGTFPNSPITLTQTFRIAEGAITTLEIH